uniref:Adhesion G protein-coupled receptor F7 n=1 Tax=Oryzias melastigma TaxID=30732 RepID=A0A3B3DGT2_ORYME
CNSKNNYKSCSKCNSNCDYNSKNNYKSTKSSSSALLESIENITSQVQDEHLNIATNLIVFNKTTFTNSFNADFNSSVEVDIPNSDEKRKSLTAITFFSMNIVLPPRDQVNSSTNIINGKIILIQSSDKVNNISLSYDVLNNTLDNPACVFWNFTLFNGLGGWDDQGCILVNQKNGTVSCNCNHLTSFCILMSPFVPKDPALEYITFTGIGISMASLVICLIIEAIIWKKAINNTTSYLRHVSIVNIALSLLFANIWFIVGATISNPQNQNNLSACSVVTFFIHFFYLALFFWMLALGLLLINSTVNVLSVGPSKAGMLAIGFSLGYGASLVIAAVTVAVTAPPGEYIRDNNVCWLNWDKSKALLAFVIPALLIVLINLIILATVISKLVKSKAGKNTAQDGERHILVVIAKSLAVLTPFLGLTWGLGFGTVLYCPFPSNNYLCCLCLLIQSVRSQLASISQTLRSQTGVRLYFYCICFIYISIM